MAGVRATVMVTRAGFLQLMSRYVIPFHIKHMSLSKQRIIKQHFISQSILAFIYWNWSRVSAFTIGVLLSGYGFFQTWNLFVSLPLLYCWLNYVTPDESIFWIHHYAHYYFIYKCYVGIDDENLGKGMGRKLERLMRQISGSLEDQGILIKVWMMEWFD